MKAQFQGSGARGDSVLAFYPTVESFAIEMNLQNCLGKYVEFNNPLDALKSKKIKISELSAIYGEKEISGWISLWLISLSKYMDFSISDEQAEITGIGILSDMYMLNISELTLLFSRIIKGHYGIFYGKFNMQTVLLACKHYRNERGLLLTKMNDSQQRKILCG